MNAPDQHKLGLYNKFTVSRVDGTDIPGGKHHGDEYFVLNLTTDRNALPAIAAYAEACAADYPILADDLRAKVALMLATANEFVTVPETTLPNGTVVPTFQVARYLSSQEPAGLPMSVSHAAPWVEINFHDAKEAATKAGYQLITETQALAIAWNVSQQDANWTGGKVGEGALYQGLHKGTVSNAQPGSYESPDANERRWMVLSNGERIYDVAGNAYTWVFDDVQGDEAGLIVKPFDAASPSITTAPFTRMEKGMGWRPESGTKWSGYALIRGGGWSSGSLAGAFGLGHYWPDGRYDGVGFRCTTKGL